MGVKKLNRGVSIIGAGYTPMAVVGSTPENQDFTERELVAAAAIEAMEDAGIKAKDIDAFTLGACAPNVFAKGVSCTPHFADWMGLHGKAGWLHDEGCATGLYGVHQAIAMVASGMYDCVLAVGYGLNSSGAIAGYPPFLRRQLSWDEFMDAAYCAVDPVYDTPGCSGVAYVDANLHLYFKKYGYTAQDFDDAMSRYLETQRLNALNNPKSRLFTQTFKEEAAGFGFENVKDYLQDDIFNPRLGSVVRNKYLGTAADGAAAIIVCATEIANKYAKKPIHVTGLGEASNVCRDWYELTNGAYRKLAHDALEMAGITDPYHEIEYMGVHDCTGASLLNEPEIFGYLKPGEALRAVAEGRVGPQGDKPMDTDGGRSQLGHPTGGAMGIEITEAVKQMRGEAGARQVANPPKTSVISVCGAGFNFASMILQCK